MQEEGDIVYVPHGCFHAVLNLEVITSLNMITSLNVGRKA